MGYRCIKYRCTLVTARKFYWRIVYPGYVHSSVFCWKIRKEKTRQIRGRSSVWFSLDKYTIMYRRNVKQIDLKLMYIDIIDNATETIDYPCGPYDQWIYYKGGHKSGLCARCYFGTTNRIGGGFPRHWRNAAKEALCYVSPTTIDDHRSFTVGNFSLLIPESSETIERRSKVGREMVDYANGRRKLLGNA